MFTRLNYSSLLSATALNAESWPNLLRGFCETGPSSGWSSAWALVKQLLCSSARGAPALPPNLCSALGPACCHPSLNTRHTALAPAQGDSHYGVTCAYFCTPI